jgi:hypothetical protein
MLYDELVKMYTEETNSDAQYAYGALKGAAFGAGVEGLGKMFGSPVDPGVIGGGAIVGIGATAMKQKYKELKSWYTSTHDEDEEGPSLLFPSAVAFALAGTGYMLGSMKGSSSSAVATPPTAGS